LLSLRWPYGFRGVADHEQSPVEEFSFFSTLFCSVFFGVLQTNWIIFISSEEDAFALSKALPTISSLGWCV
jgi:hypothetical protein